MMKGLKKCGKKDIAFIPFVVIFLPNINIWYKVIPIEFT